MEDNNHNGNRKYIVWRESLQACRNAIWYPHCKTSCTFPCITKPKGINYNGEILLYQQILLAMRVCKWSFLFELHNMAVSSSSKICVFVLPKKMKSIIIQDIEKGHPAVF